MLMPSYSLLPREARRRSGTGTPTADDIGRVPERGVPAGQSAVRLHAGPAVFMLRHHLPRGHRPGLQPEDRPVRVPAPA